MSECITFDPRLLGWLIFMWVAGVEVLICVVFWGLGLVQAAIKKLLSSLGRCRGSSRPAPNATASATSKLWKGSWKRTGRSEFSRSTTCKSTEECFTESQHMCHSLESIYFDWGDFQLGLAGFLVRRLVPLASLQGRWATLWRMDQFPVGRMGSDPLREQLVGNLTFLTCLRKGTSEAEIFHDTDFAGFRFLRVKRADWIRLRSGLNPKRCTAVCILFTRWGGVTCLTWTPNHQTKQYPNITATWFLKVQQETDGSRVHRWLDGVVLSVLGGVVPPAIGWGVSFWSSSPLTNL